MARVKRDPDDNSKDISLYDDLGEMHWQVALEKAYSPGIDTVAVCPEMMHIRGVKRLIPRHKSRDKVMVIYDREYVFYRMYGLFVKKLGIVVNDVFDNTRYEVIVNGLREYSLNEFKREREREIRIQAELLNAKFPGKGMEFWTNALAEHFAIADKKNEIPEIESDDVAVHEIAEIPQDSNAIDSQKGKEELIDVMLSTPESDIQETVDSSDSDVASTTKRGRGRPKKKTSNKY